MDLSEIKHAEFREIEAELNNSYKSITDIYLKILVLNEELDKYNKLRIKLKDVHDTTKKYKLKNYIKDLTNNTIELKRYHKQHIDYILFFIDQLKFIEKNPEYQEWKIKTYKKEI